MRVQFATLGTEPNVVLNAIRHVPMDEIHLFTDNIDSSEVVSVEKFYDTDPLNIPVKVHKIDAFDLMDCLTVFIAEIKKIRNKYEKKFTNFEITLNMTGGTKIMISAILLAGYMTGGKVFYIKKKREERGIGELIWVPMPRISASDLRETKADIIKVLGNEEEAISLTDLKNRMEKMNSVQGLTKHIQYFEEEGLIESKYVGRKRNIKLTNSGRVLLALMEY